MGSRVTGLGLVGVRGGWDPRVVKSRVVGHREVGDQGVVRVWGVIGVKGIVGSRGGEGQGLVGSV